MRIINAIICNKSETLPEGLTLTGVFSEIAKEPVPSSIDCVIVVTFMRDNKKEQPGEVKKLKVELVHSPTSMLLLIGEGDVAIPNWIGQLVIKSSGMPLNGGGEYFVTITDITQPQEHPHVDTKPLFAVTTVVAGNVETQEKDS